MPSALLSPPTLPMPEGATSTPSVLDPALFLLVNRGILALANETLSEIASYLSDIPHAFTSFLASCRRLDAAGAPVRYTSIVIEGSRGRRLLASLLSGTGASRRYRLLVKRIWFRGYHEREMVLSAGLLAQLLQHTFNLVTLWLEAGSLDTVTVTEKMKRHGIIRVREHPSYSFDAIGDGDDVTAPYTVPFMSYYKVSGDPSLASLAHHRCLTELELCHLMDHEAFAKLLEGAEGSHLSTHLEILSIKLISSLDIKLSLYHLSITFPSLRSLSLDQTSLDMTATLRMLAEPSPIFPLLRRCCLNRLYNYRMANGRKTPLLAGLTKRKAAALLSALSTNHKCLVLLGLGRNLFYVGGDGKYYHRLLMDSDEVWKDVFGKQYRVFMSHAAFPYGDDEPTLYEAE